MEALIQFHRYESTGKLDVSGEEYRRTNGFANGKWALKVVEEMAAEDIRSGNACKFEFYNSAGGWYWKKILENIVSGPLFGFDKYRTWNDNLAHSPTPRRTGF